MNHRDSLLIVLLLLFGCNGADSVPVVDESDTATRPDSTVSSTSADSLKLPASPEPSEPPAAAESTESPALSLSNESPAASDSTASSESSEDRTSPGFPDFVSNLVVVRSEHAPDYPVNGIYFKQSRGRPIIISPLLPGGVRANRKDEPVTVQMGPHSSTRQSLSGRVIGGAGHSMLLIEVIDDVPAPQAMDFSEADLNSGHEAYILAYPRESENDGSPGLFTSTVRGSATLPDVDRSVPAGGLVCDAFGRPWGILGVHDFSRRSLPRSGFSFSRLEARLRPRVNTTISMLGLQVGRRTWRAGLALEDPLETVEECELWVGTLGALDPEISEYDRARYDGPVTTDMHPVRVCQADRRGQAIHSYAIVAWPRPTSSAWKYHVLQARLKLKDGTEYFTRPGFTKPGGGGLFEINDENLSGVDQDLVVGNLATDHWQPEVTESEEPESKSVTSGRSTAWYLHLTGLGGKASDQLLDDVAWSPDGQFAFVMTRYGRLSRIDLKTRRVVRYLDLLEMSSDLDLSQSGLITLSQQQLRLIDPESLEIISEIHIPGAKQAAAGSASTDVYVVSSSRIYHVDLNTMKLTDVSVKPAAGPGLPARGVLTGVEMTEDGASVILSDEGHLHRCRLDQGRLVPEQSTQQFDRSAGMVFQQEDHRAALVPAMATGGVVRAAGMPRGGVMVFSIDNLLEPMMSSGNRTPVFDPVSGGVFRNDGPAGGTSLLRDDGVRVAGVPTLGDLEFGSRNPNGTQLLVIRDQFRLVELPPELIAGDSLRAGDAGEAVPESETRQLAGPVEVRDGWKVVPVEFDVDWESIQQQGLHVPKFRLNSVQWGDEADVCFMLSADGVLRRVRVPELVEERRLNIGNCQALERCSLGLLVRSTVRQELILIDEDSLEVIRRVPVAEPYRLTAARDSSRVWFTNPGDRNVGVSIQSFDLATGRTGPAVSMQEVSDQLRSLESVHSVPDRMKGAARLRITPDGRYLFAADGESLFRFAVQGDQLRLEDAVKNLASQSIGPIFVSHDSRLVALQGGRRMSRKSYPSGNGKGYGSYVFPVDDFNTVAVNVATDAYGDALAFNTVTGEVYSRSHKISLLVYGPESDLRESVSFGQSTRIRLDAAPSGSGLFWSSDDGDVFWLMK